MSRGRPGTPSKVPGKIWYDMELLEVSQRVMRHWHSLLREAVDVPSPEVFKAILDGALSSHIALQVYFDLNT